MKRLLTSSYVTGGVLCVVLAWGLSACSDDEKNAAASSGSAGGDSSAATDSRTKQPETEGREQDGDDAIEASGTGCLVGTWLVDNKEFGALLNGAAAAAPGATMVSEPTGLVQITFADDGEYGVTYRAWTFEMSQQGQTIQVARNGTDNGTYQAEDDGSLMTSETDMSSAVTVTAAGANHSTSSEPSTTIGTFTCMGDRLKVTAEGAASVMTRQ